MKNCRLHRGRARHNSLVGLAALLVSAPALLASTNPHQESPQQGDSKRLKLLTSSSSEMVFDLEESRDGNRLLTRLKRGSNDSIAAVKLWEPRTMRTLALLGGWNQEVRTAFFTKDSKYVITQSDQLIRVYDALKGRLVSEVHVPDTTKEAAWGSVRVSADSKIVVGTTMSGKVVRWSLTTPKDMVTIQSKGQAPTADVSPDGSLTFVSSGGGNLVLDAQLKPKLTLASTARFAYLEFSTDGKQVAATDYVRKKVDLFDVSTGKQLFEGVFEPSTERFATQFMASAFVGPNRNWYYTAAGDGTVSFYDRVTQQLVRTWHGHTAPIREIRISPDGSQFGTYGDDNQLKLYSVSENKEHEFSRYNSTPTAGGFDSRSKFFWVGYGDGAICRHHLYSEKGDYDVMVKSDVRPPEDIRFVDGGRSAYVAFRYGSGFNRKESGVMMRLEHPGQAPTGFWGSYQYVAPNGRYGMSRNEDGDLEFQDFYNPQRVKAQKSVFKADPYGVNWSPDSTRMITFHKGGQVFVWDTETLEMVAGWELNPAEDPVGDNAFSPDGKLLVSTGFIKKKGDKEHGLLWNPYTGEFIKELKETDDVPSRVLWAKDGSKFYIRNSRSIDAYDAKGNFLYQSDPIREKEDTGGYFDGTWLQASKDDKILYMTHSGRVTLYDAATGKKIKVFKDMGSMTYYDEIISDDSKRILLSEGNVVHVMEIATGKVLFNIELNDTVRSAGYSPNGDRIITSDYTDNVGIWATEGENSGKGPGADHTHGKKLGSVVVKEDGSWLVMDEDGRFDASDPSNVDSAAYVLEWEQGLEPIEVSQLKGQYYEPELLAKLMGINKEPVREVPDMQSLRLYPAVSFDQAKGDLGMVKVAIKERDKGGIGDVKVAINGKTVLRRGGTGLFEFNPADYKQYLLPESVLPKGATNTMTVTVANEDGDLLSPEATLDLGIPQDLKTPQVKLYALCVGVGDYVGSSGDLMAPPSDATGIAAALGKVSNRLLKGNQEITTLTTKDQDVDKRPSRSRVMKWFEDVSKKATSSDIVFVFFAGHGTDKVGDKSGYFFLTQDADPSQVTAAALGTSVITGDDLQAALGKIPAGKQVVVLDTCHSGAAAKNLLTANRSTSGDYQRAYESIKDATGTWMLAGSASDQLSYEASNVDHGMLTYSLLEAIDKVSPDALREGSGGDMFVDVERWLTYAANRVDSLKTEAGVEGVQRPEFKRSKASQSFDIGVTKPDFRGEIGLASPKPIVIVGTFQQEEEDPAGLEQFIGEQARNSNSIKAWFDVTKHPNVYRVAGQYSVEGTTVKLKVFLQQFDGQQNRKTLATFDVSGDKAKLSELAKVAMHQVEEKIDELELARKSKPKDK